MMSAIGIAPAAMTATVSDSPGLVAVGGHKINMHKPGQPHAIPATNSQQSKNRQQDLWQWAQCPQ